MKREKFTPKKGYPVAKDLYYRCTTCGDLIPSQPEDSIGCQCGNLFIDIDYARISVKRDKDIELYRGNPD